MATSYKTAFLQIFKKAKVDKRLGIHYNGVNNLYPNEIETVIAESVTAQRCSALMVSYLIGKGFEGNNDLIINETTKTTLYEFGEQIGESLANHNGVFIHVNYDAELKHKDYKVYQFSDCRVGKRDSNKYSGKILVCDDWSDTKLAKDATVIDVYNENPDVIREQIKKAGGDINQYKGQIFFYNGSRYIYPLSLLHPSRNDAESETQAGIYKHTSLKKGFFGKTLVVTKPLIDGTLEKGTQEYTGQVNERDEFRGTIQKFIGGENVDGILHIEMEFDEKLDDEILFKNIESNIDDKLFAFTESSVRNNVRMCFYNVPGPLIESQDGKLFSQSGEAIKAMKVFYQDQTLRPRVTLTQIVNKLLVHFDETPGKVQVTPLIDTTVTEEPKAQKFKLTPVK